MEEDRIDEMPNYDPEVMEEMKLLREEDSIEQSEDDTINRNSFQDALGIPEAEPKYNQHTFLANSLFLQNSEKVTFMTESELGRPLFSLRFLLDIEDICKFYLDEIAKEYELNNKIASYFRDKIDNICSSGMSHKGFVQNLNASKKIDISRSRIRNLEPLKGGGKQ